MLIASGNLSFLNWLTIIPAIMCFDDQTLLACIPVLQNSYNTFLMTKQAYINKYNVSMKTQVDNNTIYIRELVFPKSSWKYLSISMRTCVHVCLFCLISYLSVPVIRNLLSQEQVHIYALMYECMRY